MTFKELNLIDPLCKALEQEGYVSPTPIQSEAIPIVLEGYDLLGCAQTGTGKTAAFSLPILQHIYSKRTQSKPGVKALILTPTRELAIQIGENFNSYGFYTGLSHTVIFGGVGQKPQIDALKKKVDILIATPGRLLDLIGQGFIHLDSLEYFVLDEADRMLDMGFINDIKRILPLLPKKKQSLFFSATMPPVIEKLASAILINPRKVEVTPVSSTVDKIQQYIYFVDKAEKMSLLKKLLEDPALESILIFTRTKYGADKVVRALKKVDLDVVAIHGNKSQTARQTALKNFKDHAVRGLIATDIAARGIDVDQLSHVINYDLPNVPETYVHRIGRTGRAGHEGVAISFCSLEEVTYLFDIQNLIGKEIEVVSHEFESEEVKKEVNERKQTTKSESKRSNMFAKKREKSYWKRKK